MQYKITNEQPFQVLCSSFSISPSQQNYTLNISADGRNYSPLFTVASGQTRLVTGVASGSFYKLVGNQSEVTVNWVRSCNDGGGGAGGNAGELEPVTDFPVGAPAGTVVALSSGGTVGVYQYDGTDWASIGEGDMSNYYTKAETDSAITSATQDFATEADITAATSPIQEQVDDVERVTASALTELHQDVLDLSGATSNYYTKQETDTQIADAIADIPQPDLSNYYTKDEIGTKEEVVSRALNDLHEDILDLSGATPDLSNYYTSAQTDAAIAQAVSGLATEQYVQDALSGVNMDNYYTSAQTEEAISAATDDMKTYTDNRIDGYDSAVTLTRNPQHRYLIMNGSNVYEADEVGWEALGSPWLFTTNMQQYDLGNAPGDPNLGRPNYAKFNYVGETNSVGEFTGVYYALPANGEFVEGVPVQLTRTTSVPETIYNTPALTAGTGYYIWDNVNLTITWKRQPVIEQHIPGVVKSDGEITKVKKLTQAEYDAITTPDASTLYIITNS